MQIKLVSKLVSISVGTFASSFTFPCLSAWPRKISAFRIITFPKFGAPTAYAFKVAFFPVFAFQEAHVSQISGLYVSPLDHSKFISKKISSIKFDVPRVFCYEVGFLPNFTS